MKNFFLTVLIILSACSPSEEPENLIASPQMTKLLLEIHVLEAKINELSIVPDDSSQFVYNHYENLLFEEMGITTEQYESSFNYYLNHPKQFEKIYNAVVDSLLQMEKTAAD